jgi:translocation and assembly module TamB
MMRKVLIALVIGFAVIYGLLHVVLASGPVQRKILKEITAALASQGIEVSIESIELSFFAPRIYLNRVSITTTERAEIQFDHPLQVDKIKVEFQPLGLLNREIVLEEVALFHPKVQIPQADKLYQKVVSQIEKRKRLEVKSKGWPVVFRRFGIVDSQFEVSSSQPSFSIRSRNLTVFFSQTSVGQQTVEVQSSHFEMKRGKLELILDKLDGDVDFTEQSVRANRLVVQGPGIKLQWKGAFALPQGGNKQISSFHLAHETQMDLTLLDQIEELKEPRLSGTLISSGTLHVGKDNYSGTGTLEWQKSGVQKMRLGDWRLGYSLSQKGVELSKVVGKIASGTIESDLIKVGLEKGYPVQGELSLKKLNLNEFLDAFSVSQAPLFANADGKIKFRGTLDSPRKLQIEPDVRLSQIVVINKAELGMIAANTIIAIPRDDIRGVVNLQETGLDVKLENELLGGKLELQGAVNDGRARFHFEGKQVSLDQLKNISELPFGGTALLRGDLRIIQDDVNVEGEIDIQNAEISELKLGAVRGKVQYRKDLLSFSKLELKALEAARGQGFVDFTPKETTYRFDVNVPRISMEQTLSLFDKVGLPVQKPRGGELAARVTIEGGKDEKGVDVHVDGQARSFEWYDEKWMSAGFGIRYRPDSFKVNRGVFLKRSGSLEVKATFDKKEQELVFFTSGLRLEDLNHLGASPLQGEITGRLAFEGDLNYPRGNGELLISKIQFKGQRMSDARLALRSSGKSSEYWLDLEKEALKAHLVRKDVGEGKAFSRLDISCQETELSPYLSAWLGRDISPLNGIIISGSAEIEGDFSRPSDTKGSAEVKNLKLNFEDGPLVSDEIIKVRFDKGGVNIPRLRLSGSESEVTGSLSLVPGQEVDASLKGKLALEFLQPFIPGIDYASGLVNINVEATGAPGNYELFGNMTLSESVFRITGMQDEFRAVAAQVNLTPQKMIFERFQGILGGGEVVVGGEVGINRFNEFAPKLSIFVSKVNLQLQSFLKTRLTGELQLVGKGVPYRLSGRLRVDEAVLSSLEAKTSGQTSEQPALSFDIKADANDQLFVRTDVVDAEFSGDFKIVGDTNTIGLLGKTEVLKGKINFKDTPFEIISGTARFEREDEIFPRFAINGRSVVREQKGRAYQDYEVNLQALGTPNDYKIRLTSNPPLAEQDLISLLVLGVTTRGQEGNYFDLGTAIMGQSPIRSKIQSELGLDIKVQSAPGQGPTATDTSSASAANPTSPGMVPAVRIEKGLTKKTKISYSNTLDQNQTREIRLEQMLDDNITVNATAGDRSRNNTQARPGDSFGLDLRYRFSFE